MACQNPITVSVSLAYSATVAEAQKFSVIAWDCYGQNPSGGVVPANAILDFSGAPIQSLSGDYLTSFNMTNFSDFTLLTSPTGTEYLVGYSTAVPGGERKVNIKTAAAPAIADHVAATDPHGDRAYSVQRANHTGTQAGTTITEDSTHRWATDAEKSAWNAKQDALGNASTLTKITESAGAPLWNGATWPSSGGGTVTNVSVTSANGVSGSVANPSTTPAITLTLGAITPTSVAATGTVTGSNLSGVNTGDQTSVSGNAGTATKLQTARNINGVLFDGTADITVTAVDSTARAAASAAQTTAQTIARQMDSPLSQIRSRLRYKYGYTVSEHICTDSTGVGPNNWPYLMAQALAAAQPNYCVRVCSFGSYVDSQPEVWGTMKKLFASANGYPQIAYTAGTPASVKDCPFWPANGATGGAGWRIEIEAKFTTWASTNVLFSRENWDGTQRQWDMEIEATSSQLIFKYNNGSNLSTLDQSLYFGKLTDRGIGLNQWVKLRLTYSGESANAYNGNQAKVFRAYYSTDDGVTWTSFGSDQTVTVTPGTSTNLDWHLGTYVGFAVPAKYIRDFTFGYKHTGDFGTNEPSTSATYTTLIPSGIGKWKVNNDPRNGESAIWKYDGDPCLDIWIGASGGKNLSDIITIPAATDMWGDYKRDAVLVGVMHNSVGYSDAPVGATLRTDYAGFVSYVKTAMPGAALVHFSEMPLSTTWRSTTCCEFNQRVQSFGLTLARENGMPVIDTKGYIESSLTLSQIDASTDSSGIHQNVGSIVTTTMANYMASLHL
jgi:hypothetical protein